MQRKLIVAYLFILMTLLVLMSMSRTASEKWRGQFVALLSPVWEKITSTKSTLSRFPHSDITFKHETGAILSPLEEIGRLRLENQLINNELTHLNELIDHQQDLNAQLKEVDPEATFNLDLAYQKYLQRLKNFTQLKMEVLPARVIFRSLDTWNSFLWINVGSIHNHSSENIIVAHNSPVLSGDSIIGVIDYVGYRQSRVRLITDPALTPSVRAARGGEQDLFLGEQIENLIHSLNSKKSVALSEGDQESLKELLAKLKTTLKPQKKTWYLAKGELKGNLQAAGRSQSEVLKGVGFNFDFDDSEGKARDLRTGKPLSNPQGNTIPILKINDTLVTTGMDGVFPPNLRIATVSKIDLLKEGDYFYELEAIPTAGHLNELSIVFVIPPIGYDKKETEGSIHAH